MKKLEISEESGTFLSKVQNDLNRKVLKVAGIFAFIYHIRLKILREEEHFHLICDFIDDLQET